MRRWSRRDWVLGAVAGIGLFLIALTVSLGILSTGRRLEEYRRGQVRMDNKIFRSAVTTYSSSYGALPAGNNATVTTALRGENSKRQVFLELPSQSVNERGEFLDPWRRPYDIEVTTNAIRFQSLSKGAPRPIE